MNVATSERLEVNVLLIERVSFGVKTFGRVDVMKIE
jgi:hypothetical protein